MAANNRVRSLPESNPISTRLTTTMHRHRCTEVKLYLERASGCQRPVRFFALLRIKPPPLGRAIIASFSTLRSLPGDAYALAAAAKRRPNLALIVLQREDCRVSNLFAPHAFRPRQLQTRGRFRHRCSLHISALHMEFPLSLLHSS